ncbi:DUF2809 domain-containing protein [Algibacter sp. Ld11]|uniref:ribosomal maturation YjgA family protein n=1 Tax=Algibacter sp. Ld11 TaxID=649150 RepID=UPI003866C3EF
MVLTIALLIVEILIAVYLKTGFIRYTVGDFLSVILLYCFFRSFLEIRPLKLGMFVLIFAFFIEYLQLLNILHYFHLDQYKILNIILGSTFQIGDLVAYTLGIITVLIIEHLNFKFYELR